MAELIRIRVRPDIFSDKNKLEESIQKKAGGTVSDWKIVRKSIDARQKQVWIDAEFLVSREGPVVSEHFYDKVNYSRVPDNAPEVIIVGAGPAGLFAALRAIEKGWRPVLLERGKPVEERIHDVVSLQKDHRLDPDSNFCFGEGGAGAFSDGKLFTRSKKRGNVKEVLGILHQHGAKAEILYEAHPHIGSDKLPGVIRNIRQTIIDNGGAIYFSTPMKELIISEGKVLGVRTDKGQEFYGPVILATGHSAHDVYEYLASQDIKLQQKGFAMGVRLEHPQPVIDRMIYHNREGRGKYLPPAEYKLATQVEGRGVYSFCMCPGGVIVPSASAPGESVVNGMSASGRSGRWANSGLVVEIRPEDYPEYSSMGDLGMLRLQQETERRFYKESDSLNAPAQRMKDFIDGKISKSLPSTSYVPGIHSADIASLLPHGVGRRLRDGLKIFGEKNKGFITNDATLIGLESRTSSPVRIPRDIESYQHPELEGLYPAGEGAGFSGGIVSSAIDGRNVMDAIIKNNKI